MLQDSSRVQAKRLYAVRYNPGFGGSFWEAFWVQFEVIFLLIFDLFSTSFWRRFGSILGSKLYQNPEFSGKNAIPKALKNRCRKSMEKEKKKHPK